MGTSSVLLTDVVLDPSSPWLIVVYVALYVGCALLGFSAGRRGAPHRIAKNRREPTPGAEIALSVGMAVIMGLIAFSQGTSTLLRAIYLLVIPPLAIIGAARAIRKIV